MDIVDKNDLKVRSYVGLVNILQPFFIYLKKHTLFSIYILVTLVHKLL